MRGRRMAKEIFVLSKPDGLVNKPKKIKRHDQTQSQQPRLRNIENHELHAKLTVKIKRFHSTAEFKSIEHFARVFFA